MLLNSKHLDKVALHTECGQSEDLLFLLLPSNVPSELKIEGGKKFGVPTRYNYTPHSINKL